MGNVQVHIDNRKRKEEGSMGQGSSRSGKRKKTFLELALEKVGVDTDDLTSLPTTKNDDLWNAIQATYGLTPLELSALKNYRVSDSSRMRGVLSGIQDDTLYKISDNRVRCSFTIRRMEMNVSMPAELMVDTGAEGELKLPGRKVVQLQLQIVGKPVRTKVSSNAQGSILNFYPPVMVSAKFFRKDENGETKEEVLEALLSVRAEKSDYEDALKAHAEANESQSSMPCTPGSELPSWLGPTTLTTPGGTAGIPCGVVQLSPVRHRPLGKAHEQATLGISGLAKLRMHVNAEKNQLKIEEEEFIED